MSLDRAFAEARKLPEEQQEIFATFLLAELKDESAWLEKFSESQDLLSVMAKEARAEYDAGQTQPLGNLVTTRY